MTNKKNKDFSIKLATTSAWDVSKYLLSLDPNREYFSNKRVLITDKYGYYSKPTIGNFRLNKMLQMIQTLYYSCYRQPLFKDEMVALEHGGIVFEVYRKFLKLYGEKDHIPLSLTKEQKEFIQKVYFFMRDNYSDRELREVVREDLAWSRAWHRSHCLKWKRKKNAISTKFDYSDEVIDYHEKLSSSFIDTIGLKRGGKEQSQ